MKARSTAYLSRLVPLLASLLITAGMANADSVSDLPLAAGASFTARIGDKDFKPDWISSSQTTIGGKAVLNVAGHVGEGVTSTFINCSVVEPKVGVIQIGVGSLFARSGCTYVADPTDVFNKNFHLKQGSIEITELDLNAKTVSGKFTGSGDNMAKSRSVQITDGVFTRIPLDSSSRLK